mgnify:CR=1 FL=1
MGLPVIGGSDGAWGTTLNNFLGGADGAGVPTIPNNRIPYLASGNHTSSANLTFDGTTLTVPAAVVTASAALTITPAAGTNLNINLSTTGDLAVNTSQLYVDTSTGFVGFGTTGPEVLLHVTGILAGALLDVLKVDNASGVASSEVGIVFENGADRTARISSSNEASDLGPLKFWTAGSIDTLTERMRITISGNAKIAGTASRATTEGTNHLDIFDGTAPVGTLAAGISLYSTTGELRVMDSGGTPTLLSATSKKILANSNPAWMPWAFDKSNPYTGEYWEVNMGKLLAWAEAQSGQKFTELKLLAVKLDWDTDQEKMRLEQEKQVVAAQNQIAELSNQIVTESDLVKKAELTKERDSIKVPLPYTKKRPPQWMVNKGVKTAIVEV